MGSRCVPLPSSHTERTVSLWSSPVGRCFSRTGHAFSGISQGHKDLLRFVVLCFISRSRFHFTYFLQKVWSRPGQRGRPMLPCHLQERHACSAKLPLLLGAQRKRQAVRRTPGSKRQRQTRPCLSLLYASKHLPLKIIRLIYQSVSRPVTFHQDGFLIKKKEHTRR